MTWLDTHPSADTEIAKLDALPTEHPLAKTWQHHLEYAGHDKGFALFLAYCDRRIRRSFGVTIHDMPDWTWRDAFDATLTPQQAVLSFAEDNRDDLGFED